MSFAASQRQTVCAQSRWEYVWSEMDSIVRQPTTVKELKVTNMPAVVSAEEWQQDRDELLKLEKEATRTLDALAARRRRLPDGQV